MPWFEALKGLLVPTIKWNGTFLTTLVAVLGTTISPYLFVWQSSQEAEEQRIDPAKRQLKENAATKKREMRRIRIDTMVGMAISNIIAISIIITTAATLHAKGVSPTSSRRRRQQRHSSRSPGHSPRVLFGVGSEPRSAS